MTVPILILAGGASRRMGSRDKLLEDVDGQPLLRLQAQRALEASPDVTVLIRPDKPGLEQVLIDLPVKLLKPEEAFEGMGGSIRAGTQSLLQSPCFLLVLADLVALTGLDMQKIIAARSPDSKTWIWRGATTTGKPGHPILFESPVYDDLLQLRGDTGGQKVIEKHIRKVQLVPLPDDHARLDLDTVEDWDAWRRSGVKLS